MGMKNKKVIVHIGTRKTGTSSIQKTLGENRSELIRHNIYYPGFEPYNHISTFTPIFLEDPKRNISMIKRGVTNEEEADRICNRLRNKWIKEFKKCECDNFIISAESLSLPKFNLNAVKRMRIFLEEYFEEIQIIVYFRSFNALMNSQVQQHIKNGITDRTFIKIVDSYINNPKLGIHYSGNIAHWEKVFGLAEIIIRPFDKKSFYNDSLVDDFLFSLGFNPNDIAIHEYKTNEALGKNAIVFLEKYNQRYPGIKNGLLNHERGLGSKYPPIEVYQKCDDEKFTMDIHYTREQAELINREVDYANQFFEDEYKFSHVEAREGDSVYPVAEDIPLEYFIDLINNYNQYIDELKTKDLNENLMVGNGVLSLYLLSSKRKVVVLKNLVRYAICRLTGLRGFDKEYYVKKYPFVTDRVKDPLLHFLVRGVYRGYNPNPEFNVSAYVAMHPEIILTGENALIHYIKNNKQAVDGLQKIQGA